MKLKSLLVVLLAGVALSGCHRMDPNSPEAKRQAIFKEMLRTSEDMGGMLRGRLPFDAEKFRAGSAKLHQLADQPWQYFPVPRPARRARTPAPRTRSGSARRSSRPPPRSSSTR